MTTLNTPRSSRPAPWTVLAAGLASGVLLLPGSGLAQTPGTGDDQALLQRYCITCHNTRANTANLALDTLSLDRVGEHAEAWEKVVRKIKSGMMPPSGVRRPERQDLDRFAAALEDRLDRAAPVAPGAPALHRLNRTEYANAIRDLLALDVDVTRLLPADDATGGFDNIADVLGVSPSLIQGYVSAAMKISRWAVGDRSMIPSRSTYNVPSGLAQDQHIEGLPLGTRGGMLVDHTFPLNAEYELSIGGGAGRGGGPGVELVVTLDGEPLTVDNPRSFTMPMKAGPHRIGMAMVDNLRPTGVNDVFSVFSVRGAIQTLVITGPLNPTGPGETPSRERIFVCRPDGPEGAAAGATNGEACAREILSTLARRAFRRPVRDDELDTLIEFYREGASTGDFETGIQQAVARVLIAPSFLFRIEEEPEGLADGQSYRLSDLELASRLSFFLWSTIPDDELLDIAAAGRLSDDGVLEHQVRRMLADPRAGALIDNFAAQWLSLRVLDGVQPAKGNFDENLRHAFKRETELLFDTIMREDRSIVDLIDADYTFVDERLAAHYHIPDVTGSYFRRIPIPAESPRRGIIGHGSVLTATSTADRTSPVVRGKWVLENLLGAPPPSPPPGVETNLDTNPEGIEVSTLRARLEFHRTNPVCASCHKIMDPVGFALENFDLVGEWRDVEGQTPIDASGVLVDGTPLHGPMDLQRALLDRSDTFVEVAAEKLMTYAVGRSVRYTDMPAVRAVVRAAAPNDYRFSSLVLGVVRSAPFRMKQRLPPSGNRERTDAAGQQASR